MYLISNQSIIFVEIILIALLLLAYRKISNRYNIFLALPENRSSHELPTPKGAGFFIALLVDLVAPLSALEKAASSIFLLVLERLLDTEEDLAWFSLSNLEVFEVNDQYLDIIGVIWIKNFLKYFKN